MVATLRKRALLRPVSSPVIQSPPLSFRAQAKNRAEAKRHCISDRKTSFRSHEIATPNKSARNDKYVWQQHLSVSFRAQAKNLAEAKRHCISDRKTSFRSHEIATPNKSARNDKYVWQQHLSVSFRAQAKNLAEAKRKLCATHDAHHTLT